MEAQPTKTEDAGQRRGLLASHEQNAKFDALGRRAAFRANRWNYVLGATIVFIPLLYLSNMMLQNARTLAILNMPAKYGQAYIISKDATMRRTKMNTWQYDIAFRLNGRLLTVTTLNADKWTRTPTETTVPVTYHIGKNGEVLISDWQVPPAK